MSEDLPIDAVSPAERLDWALKRIKDHEGLLALLAGQVAGLSWGVKCLIISHPEIETMHSTWSRLSPEAIDAEMEHPLHRVPPFRQGLHAAMASIQGIAEQRLAQSRGSG